MKIVNRKILDDFKQAHADVKSHADTWGSIAGAADWSSPHDVKKRFSKASILADNQVVFNLRGNKYRLLVQISYNNKIIFIKKIGTHSEYNKWQTN